MSEGTIDNKYSRAFGKIIEAIFEAEEKHPGWPTDPIHATAIIAEESGELTKAAIDFYFKRNDNEDEMMKEAAQTAAVLLRFMAEKGTYKQEKDQTTQGSETGAALAARETLKFADTMKEIKEQ